MSEVLEFSAWDALTPAQLATVEADIKLGTYTGWPVGSTTQVESITKILDTVTKLNGMNEEKAA